MSERGKKRRPVGESERNQKPSAETPGDEEKRLGAFDFIGIVILAGALFNLPAILKAPETEAEKMMLVIVLAMLVMGGMLVGLPRLFDFMNRRKK